MREVMRGVASLGALAFLGGVVLLAGCKDEPPPVPAMPSASAAIPNAPRCKTMCRKFGRCTLEGATCVAKTDEECRGFTGCRHQGKCHARDGGCVALSIEDCARSLGCRQSGRCGLGADGKCVVGSSAQCKAAVACQRDGRCELKDGRCVATDAGCRSHRGCKVAGRCAAVDGKCQPGSDADCAGSKACLERNYCVKRGEFCARAQSDAGVPDAGAPDADAPDAGGGSAKGDAGRPAR